MDEDCDLQLEPVNGGIAEGRVHRNQTEWGGKVERNSQLYKK